ncbi:MAG: hypothetical protein ACHQFW_03720 [Chitinophagales bacterium]
MKNFLLGLLITPVLFTACKRNEIPEYDVRDEYIGNYHVTDACDATLSDYEIPVYKSADYSDIIFGFPGLYETGMEVAAIVTGMKIVIPIQDFYISSYPDIFYEFSGSGSLEDSVLTVDYTVLTIQNGLIIDENNCIATMIREIN